MQVISLSLTHLGLGLLIVTALVGVREVGRGFFTLCGWTGVVLTGLGWASAGLPGPGGVVCPFPSITAGSAVVLFAAGWIALRARRRGIASPLVRGSGAVAGVSVLVQGWAFARQGSPSGTVVPGFAATDFLVSAALLGGVSVAMILGHWYLVQPGLRIEPLERLSWLFIALLVLRALMETGGTAGALASGGLTLSAPPGEVMPFPALILAQRVLFGLLAPLVLAPLVHRTVKIRSTTSATGLLYVAVALVWVGEFLSKYLLLPLRLI